MKSAATPRSLRPLCAVAMVAIPSLLVAGLVSIAPITTPRASAAEPAVPAGSDVYKVSQAASGKTSNAYLAPGGQQVAFVSTDLSLVPGDDNGVADVFLSTAQLGSDPFSGVPELISVPDGAVGTVRANDSSGSPVMSADGRWVAFTSMATNLVSPASPTEMSSVYVRDTLSDTTIRLQAPDLMPDGPSYDPDISDDGRYVVFTTDATNLSPGDLNNAADSYLADLDANGDGIRGDVSLTRFVQDVSVKGGISQAVISGNGRWVTFVSATDRLFSASGLVGDYLFRAEVRTLIHDAELIAIDATEPTIDANGTTLAYVQQHVCGDSPAISMASIDTGGTAYHIALGTIGADTRFGDSWDPEISSDGNTVVWTTTTPEFLFVDNPGPLAHPVVRMQHPGWWDSDRLSIQCSGILTPDWVDVAVGDGATISASGRTLAYTGDDFTHVVDTHSNNGLSVASTQGELSTPNFVSSLPISSIPLASLRGYAGTLANAPIHQLPIHQLPIHQLPIHQLPIHQLLIDDAPIHQLPIHQLPIHQLPIHQLDLPGGWDQLLAGTTLGGQLIQTLTLDQVLLWAEQTIAACPATVPGTPDSVDCAAARRVQSLTLGDIGLDGSGLDALSLASYVLGDAPVAEIRLAGSGEPKASWQALANSQSLGVQVGDTTVLAQLDAAGLDITRAGLEDVVLTTLPIDKTLLRYLRMSELFLEGTPLGALDVATGLSDTARQTLFGSVGVTGLLATRQGDLVEGANLAQFVAGLTTEVNFGTLLFSLLDRESFPWEEIDLASLDLTKVTDDSNSMVCESNDRCRTSADFRVTFDAGPGEDPAFAAPTVSVSLPDGTQSTQMFLSGAGPDAVWSEFNEYTGPVERQGGLVRVPLSDLTSGTAITFGAWFSATSRPGNSESIAEVVSGDRSAKLVLSGAATLNELDDNRNNIENAGIAGLRTIDEDTIFYEWLSPDWLDNDDNTGLPIQAPVSDDADYFGVLAPQPGQRLVISTNAKDGQIALALYSASGASSALGVTNAGAAPARAVTEQNGIDGQPAESGADAGVALAGQTLIDQAVVGGGGTAEVEAASADSEPGERLVIRVTSGNGAPSSSMYSLRARYIDEPAETNCTPYSPVKPAADGIVGASDGLDAQTDTIYLFDQERYGRRFGAAAAAAVRADLGKLSDPALAGAGAVHGAVLATDSDLGVQNARKAADLNPCSMTARKALASAINTFVAEEIQDYRDQIKSVVVVGGDDMIPFAPVGQHTSDFTEQSHAGDLRLMRVSPTVPCPTGLTAGSIDPCATPLSAAASGGFVLTDDPYGLPDTYESLGGYLYIPTVALGRLVETPEQIQGTIARYLGSDGVLAANSSIAGGYGAWSELPEIVNKKLEWRVPADSQKTLIGQWDAGALSSAIFTGATSPRVVSINTHADETRLLPGILNAEAGTFTDDQLFKATAPTAPQLASLSGALIFLIGCHAGNNLPGAYYGNVTDWVDVFSNAGGYVGNTGYGLANNVTTALSERLLGLYADWVGKKVQTDAGAVPVSASGALTYAKQSYLGGLGLYSGYDEKVLMEAVYYGLPMYTIGGPAQDAPLPKRPTDLKPITDATNADGLRTAGFTFSPAFATTPTTVTLPDGRTVQYLTAALEPGTPAQQPQQDPLAVAGQPVLPRVVSQLDKAPDGFAARGVLLTSLVSEVVTEVTKPAIAEPNVGVTETEGMRSGGAFPSSYATISRQDTPTGPVDLLVVTPGRVVMGQAGAGQLEKFESVGLEVQYGRTTPIDVSTPVETVAPIVRAVELPSSAGGAMSITVDGTGSPVKKVNVLAQQDGGDWKLVPSTQQNFGDTWRAVPDVTGPFRWIVQVVDAYGNVATDTARGHLDKVDAPAPTLGDPGGAASVIVGDRVSRSIPAGRIPLGDRLTAKVIVKAVPDDPELLASTVATGGAVVTTAVDGTTVVQIDQVFPNIGVYTLVVSVCRGLECSEVSFPVDVRAPNSFPTADVNLAAEGSAAYPDSTLTATAAGSDPDPGDKVTMTYSWKRNGIPLLPPVAGRTLSLAEIGAQAGDVIEVAAAPFDGKVTGHIAYARVTVEDMPPTPTIEARASNALGLYVGGWSASPVKVEFICTGQGFTCPSAQTVNSDTTDEGQKVEASVTSGGHTVSASVVVFVDRTKPSLTAAANPISVPVGGEVKIETVASDAGSGLAAAPSCGTPLTRTPGANSVECSVTDKAGNTATARADYTVTSTQTRSCAGGPDRTALPPLDANGSSVFLRTSGVPVTFRACDANGNPIGTKGFAKKVVLVSTSTLPPEAMVNELSYPTMKAFTFQKQTGLWTGNILTANLTRGKKYTYRVDLSDGTSFMVSFGVR